MDQKYLLFVMGGAGLGHVLTSLLNSAYYAWRTGRVLALDMRGFSYFKSDGHASFLENFGFEFPADLQVITDLAEIERLKTIEDQHCLTYDEQPDPERPHGNQVVVDPCFFHADTYTVATRRADAPFRVVLRGRLLEEWHKVMSRPEWSGPVIGLHYRAKPGEIHPRLTKATMPDFEQRYQDVKDRYIAMALAVAKEAGYARPAFLVASDDAGFVSYVRERLPNAFSLASNLPDQEILSYVRAHGHDFRILVDAVNDMWCLSACDHFLYYHSSFAHFAVLNSRKLGEGTTHYVHVPDLQEILQSMEPQEAVAYGRGAVRKAEAKRLQIFDLHRWLADALERAGDAEGAALERQRNRWHRECLMLDFTRSPVISFSDLMEQLGRGDHSGLLAVAQRVVDEHPGNAYALAGYRHSLSTVFVHAGRPAEAILPARQALEIEPLDPFLHAHLGMVLSHNGDYAGAERSLRRAIEIDPGITSFHTDLGEYLLRQNNLEAALNEFREAARYEPEDPGLLRRVGSVLVQTRNFGEGESVIRQAIALRSDAGSHSDLSDCFARQGRLDDAIEAAQAAVAIEVTNPMWHSRLAVLLLRANRAAEAESAVRQAIALAPNNADYQDTLAQALEQQGRLEEALSEVQRAAAAAPEDAERQALLGHLMLRARRYEEAVTALSKAVELQPRVARAAYFHDLLATAWERQNRLDEAIVAARKAAELEPKESGRHGRVGNLLMNAARYAEAEAALRQAIELADGVIGFHHMLGIALDRQGRLPEAILEARRVVELAPDNSDLHTRLAALLWQDGNVAEAETVMTRTIAAHPDDVSLRRNLCAFLELQQRFEEAAEAARKLVELQPEHAASHRNSVAILLLRARKPQDAESVLRDAIERDPAVGILYETLAEALRQQGRLEAAAAALLAAAALPGAQPASHLRAAHMLEIVGQLDEAEEALRRAVAADPESAEARSRLASLIERRKPVAAVPPGQQEVQPVVPQPVEPESAEPQLAEPQPGQPRPVAPQPGEPVLPIAATAAPAVELDQPSAAPPKDDRLLGRLIRRAWRTSGRQPARTGGPAA